MSKFNIGDRVVVADPAYLVVEGEAKGYVSPDFYGQPAVITQVFEEGTADRRIGTSYEVEAVRDHFTQTISQHYLTAAPPEPVKPALKDGVYLVTLGDTVLVRDGKAVEILETNDGCPREDHNFRLGESNFLDAATRLVANPTPRVDVPNGVYTDSDGDVVHVKDGKVRYLPSGTAYHADDFEVYGPYIPLVQEDSTK